MRKVCRESAVVLDPVYSGKALYGFIKVALANPEKFRGADILFWHTGGGLGMYDKVEQIQAILPGDEVNAGIFSTQEIPVVHCARCLGACAAGSHCHRACGVTGLPTFFIMTGSVI